MSRNDTIKRTSGLLLSGWRMLASVCPICHSPLLSKDGNMLCPGCNVPVRMENDLSSSYVVPEISLGREERKVDLPIAEVEQAPAPIIPQSMEELRRDYDIRNARRNKVSDQLGQHLLRGWIMLQQCCPQLECNGTPLMRETADGPMLCLSCSTEYISINDELVPALQVLYASAEVKVPQQAIGAPLTTCNSWLDDAPILPLSSFAHHEKDSSWRISQKLMQGWRLLDEVCVAPECTGNVPLMRDKNGKIRCVDCGGVDKVQTTTKVSTTANTTFTFEEDDSIDGEEDQYVIDQMTQAAFRKCGTVEVATKNDKNNSDEQFALGVLRKKLRALSTKLDNCDQCVQVSELVDLITKLATSIKAIKEVM